MIDLLELKILILELTSILGAVIIYVAVKECLREKVKE